MNKSRCVHVCTATYYNIARELITWIAVIQDDSKSGRKINLDKCLFPGIVIASIKCKNKCKDRVYKELLVRSKA